jgi:hypothetical protein
MNISDNYVPWLLRLVAAPLCASAVIAFVPLVALAMVMLSEGVPNTMTAWWATLWSLTAVGVAIGLAGFGFKQLLKPRIHTILTMLAAAILIVLICPFALRT